MKMYINSNMLGLYTWFLGQTIDVFLKILGVAVSVSQTRLVYYSMYLHVIKVRFVLNLMNKW